MSTREAPSTVIVWGEVLWDRFPDGDQLGGAPANVAWHLGQAGGWVQLVTRVGDDDDGRRAIEKLAGAVDVSLVQVDPERATGEVTVRLEGGEPRYTLHPGRAWERIACTPEVAQAIAEASVLIYGTLAQRTADGLAGWRAAVAAAQQTCVKVCDLNLRPTDQNGPAIAAAVEAADVVKLNDRELAALRDGFGWEDPVAVLRARGKTVAVTHGAAGSTLHGDRGAIEIPGVPARPGGDNVGCGDAYVAILVHGLTLGWELADSARAASRWAAAVAGVRGATPVFSGQDIAAMLEPA
jgi:fructokinase